MLGCKGLKLGRKLPINHYVSPGEGRGGGGPKDFFLGGDGGEIDHMVLGGKRRGGHSSPNKSKGGIRTRGK